MNFQNLKQKTKDFIIKLQGLDEKQKKIIMWTIVGILAVTMGFFWIKTTLYKIENMGEINLNLPEFENTENAEIEMPVENIQNNFESKEEIENQIESLQEKLNQIETNK